MSLTTNPEDPKLSHGIDIDAVSQNEVYLVLSEEERRSGCIRPVRLSYRHIGARENKNTLRALTAEEKERHAGWGYVKYEEYPESESPLLGKFWTQEQLDAIGAGCQTVTTMGCALAETWAKNPQFYGATYCAYCRKHLDVSEFVWEGTNERLGT